MLIFITKNGARYTVTRSSSYEVVSKADYCAATVIDHRVEPRRPLDSTTAALDCALDISQPATNTQHTVLYPAHKHGSKAYAEFLSSCLFFFTV